MNAEEITAVMRMHFAKTLLGHTTVYATLVIKGMEIVVTVR